MSTHIPIQAGYVFAAIIGILLLASGIGVWLKRRKGADNPTM